MQRIRIHYTKNDQLRYTGTLDIQKVWERTFRRANVKLAFSQGFHPQPKMQMACPLPLGFTSKVEKLDIWLDNEISPDDLKQTLDQVIQPGIDITSCEEVDLSLPALQKIIQSIRYLATVPPQYGETELKEKIDQIMAKTNIFRIRRDKSYDLRTKILELSLINVDDKYIVSMLLTAQISSTGRPEEVLIEMGIDPNDCKIERVELVF
ncbi:MAG: DUF2344 domain-containing protein [Anaerolineaceae bacterium]|nr:DUF2344 domain-containing protein [Anaerolineaceae bacterium]